MTRCLFIFVMLFRAFAGAQPPIAPPFHAVEGAFFALSVQDVDASARWYAEKFGLKVASRFSDGKVAGAVLSGNGLEVELIGFAESAPQRDRFDAKNLPHGRQARSPQGPQ